MAYWYMWHGLGSPAGIILIVGLFFFIKCILVLSGLPRFCRNAKPDASFSRHDCFCISYVCQWNHEYQHGRMQLQALTEPTWNSLSKFLSSVPEYLPASLMKLNTFGISSNGISVRYSALKRPEIPPMRA